MELNICHLYPDILNLYGDRGNIITMKRRLESRGISVNVDECSIGQPLDVDKYWFVMCTRSRKESHQ